MLPENWDALRAFIACQTQWRRVAVGGRLMATGLDYGGCRAAIEGIGLDFGALLPQVQIMEAEAMRIWQEANV